MYVYPDGFDEYHILFATYCDAVNLLFSTLYTALSIIRFSKHLRYR